MRREILNLKTRENFNRKKFEKKMARNGDPGHNTPCVELLFGEIAEYPSPLLVVK